MAPVSTSLTVRAESVLAPAVIYRTFNGRGAISLVFLTGAGTLVVGPVGAVGITAPVVLTIGCVAHDRFVASTDHDRGPAVSEGVRATIALDGRRSGMRLAGQCLLTPADSAR